jgi:hypothetical protein
VVQTFLIWLIYPGTQGLSLNGISRFFDDDEGASMIYGLEEKEIGVKEKDPAVEGGKVL